MALPICTYKDYADKGGTLSETDYKASLAAALTAVHEIIGHNEPMDAEDAQAYQNAVYAAIKVDNAYGASGGIGESMASVTMGKFSASTGAGASGAASPYRHDMTAAIRGALVGSSLLYQGL